MGKIRAHGARVIFYLLIKVLEKFRHFGTLDTRKRTAVILSQITRVGSPLANYWRAGASQLINPRRACAARVTVVGSVCLCVCLLSHISPLERLFVLKTLSRPQRATKVKINVGFSLKPLRCRDPALPPLTAIRTVGHFSCGKHACAL